MDLTLQVTISRDGLGLLPLDLNDHANYYVAGDFLTGQLAWNRNQVSSPFLDDQVTTYRTLGKVTRQITIETLGESASELNANLSAVVAAFLQDDFHLAIAMDTDIQLEYGCEASDYQVNWVGSRVIARQLQVQFSVPCSPIPIVGGY